MSAPILPEQPSTAEINDAMERTQNEFSKEEIQSYANMAAKLSRAPIWRLLTKMITAVNDTSSLKDDLATLCPEKSSCACPIELPPDVQREIGMKSLNVWLSNGPRNHRTTIDVPNDEFAQCVYANYEYLKKIAQTFWVEFQGKYPYLMTQLRELLGTDVNELKIDPENLTTMYFSKDFADRIVILAAYVDSEGHMYGKK